MKNISLPDAAFEVLSSSKEAMSFADLYTKVAELGEFSEEDKDSLVGYFYTDLTLDGRFIGLDGNIWDLRERHTYAEVERKAKAAESFENAEEEEKDKEDLEEERETDAFVSGTTYSGEDYYEEEEEKGSSSEEQDIDGLSNLVDKGY